MVANSPFRSWLNRNKWYFMVGAAILGFALAPFPGLGLIYPIRDNLRGHPQGPHGSQPQNFVGLWIRDEPKLYDFVGQAFFLMPDGRFAGTPSMTVRRWHYDDDRLFVDSVSRCGNCYQGNVTAELSARFNGPDRLVVANASGNEMEIVGNYRRFQINEALRSELARLKDSKDENESFRARTTLRVIERYEKVSSSTP